MKATNNSLEPVIRSAIIESLKNYELTNDGNFLSDLYLYYDTENQSVTFFDDIEKELLAVNLNDESDDLEVDFEREVKHAARAVLKELEKENVFDREFIHKPFTVSLIDNDFIVRDELIFIDDDTLKLEEDLWLGMDKELNDFLKNLMQ
jgi:hypothetical protein